MPSTRRTEQSIFLENAVCHVRTSVAGSRVVPSIEWGGSKDVRQCSGPSFHRMFSSITS